MALGDTDHAAEALELLKRLVTLPDEVLANPEQAAALTPTRIAAEHRTAAESAAQPPSRHGGVDGMSLGRLLSMRLHCIYK
jgi:hypothetical protein